MTTPTQSPTGARCLCCDVPYGQQFHGSVPTKCSRCRDHCPAVRVGTANHCKFRSETIAHIHHWQLDSPRGETVVQRCACGAEKVVSADPGEGLMENGKRGIRIGRAKAPEEHGTETQYRRGCRLECCVAAHRAGVVEAARDRLAMRRTTSSLDAVPVEPADAEWMDAPMGPFRPPPATTHAWERCEDVGGFYDTRCSLNAGHPLPHKDYRDAEWPIPPPAPPVSPETDALLWKAIAGLRADRALLDQAIAALQAVIDGGGREAVR